MPSACSPGCLASIFVHALHTHAHSSPTRFSHEQSLLLSLPLCSSFCSVLLEHTLPAHQSYTRHGALQASAPEFPTSPLAPPPHPSNSSTPKGWVPACPQDKAASAAPASVGRVSEAPPSAPHLPSPERKSSQAPTSRGTPPQHLVRGHEAARTVGPFPRDSDFVPKCRVCSCLHFFFFVSFLKITMKLSFPPTAFPLSYLD